MGKSLNTGKILIVDDELAVCKSCQRILSEYATEIARSGEEAIARLKEESFNVVVADLKMPGMDGIELLKIIKKEYPQIIFIIITGYATVATAVEAMKGGAFDYIPKPFTPDEVRMVVKKALENKGIFSDLYVERYQFDNIIGSGPKMQELFRLIEKVAPTSGTVIIYGESGTGKELIARAIHNTSRRKNARFVAVDCVAFPTTLLESALFGHIKGAFTGAVSTKPGFFEIADGGTLFLDEIGNISLDIQGKLLRVLQEREFIPVGGTEPKKINVRLISATNKDLKEMIAKETFREDLFYRLHVVPIFLPPLRERREDIPVLAYHFLQKYSKQLNKNISSISPETMKCLVNYEWPGNVRQLENIIERVVITTESEIISPEDLPLSIQYEYTSAKMSSIPTNYKELKSAKKQIKEQSIEEIERKFLIEALKRNSWNISKTAHDIGIQRTNLHSLIRKYKIQIRGNKD